MYQSIRKRPFNIRFEKKNSPQLGLEPTKVRQDLKKSMAMRGWMKYQSKVKNQFQDVPSLNATVGKMTN